MKSLGASRARIVGAMAIEQACAGLIAALIGAGLGLGAAYVIVIQVLEADWLLNIGLVASIVGGAVTVFALAGVAIGFTALGRPPYRVLSASAEFG